MSHCPICEHQTTVKIEDYSTRFRAADGSIRELVVPDVCVRYCAQCEESLLDQAAMKKIEAAQRSALGRLSPDELRAWRTSLRKTQTELSAILGFGEKTFSRWETGAYTISAASDRYIRLVMASPDNFRRVEELAAQGINIDVFSMADDLSHVDLDGFDEEWEDLIARGDPAVKISETFSFDLEQGSVFSC